jgi:DeoR/GlpR family transcriptional regulator of sugar metabolism
MLRAEGKLVATDMSHALSVSEDTVRRELRKLAETAKLQRVHIGALPRSAVTGTHEARKLQASASKEVVARAAVRLVENGQVIILDGGTTALEVVRRLPPDLEATVVAHARRPRRLSPSTRLWRWS